MPDTAPFTGIPHETPAYLAALAANNSREWFEDHQAEHHALWLKPALDLAAALSGPCSALNPPLLSVPKINASVRRIHRDTRFSADKRPYHAQLHLILSTGLEFNKVPGVHFVLDATGFGFGAGQYAFDPAGLDRYRRMVCSARGRDRLLRWLEPAAAIGCTLDPPDLARVPKGYSVEGDWDHLIRRKGVIVRTQTHLPAPDWLFTDQAVAGLMQLTRALHPLVEGLAELL